MATIAGRRHRARLIRFSSRSSPGATRSALLGGLLGLPHEDTPESATAESGAACTWTAGPTSQVLTGGSGKPAAITAPPVLVTVSQHAISSVGSSGVT